MKCPLCDMSCAHMVVEEKSRAFSSLKKEWPLQIYICESCSFVFQGSAYQDGYIEYVEQVYKAFAKSSSFVFPNRSAENGRALDLIAKYIASKVDGCLTFNVLEIGSNRGDLLYLLKERFPQINIVGIDPLDGVQTEMITMKGIFDHAIFSNRFDLIIMQHVLEHMLWPRDIVCKVRNMMKDDGAMYVEVPNFSWNISHGIDDFSLEHVSYFDAYTLTKLMGGRWIHEKNDHFLRGIWGKDMTLHQDIRRASVPKFHIESFLKKKKEMLQEIYKMHRAGKRIVFYGVSYYFRMLFKELAEEGKLCKGFFIDDDFIEKREEYSGLCRTETISPTDVVILCSNNYAVQQQMYQKIMKYCSVIVFPWHTIQKGNM